MESHEMNSHPKENVVAVIDLGDFFQPGNEHTSAMFAQRELGGKTLVMRIAERLFGCPGVDRVVIVGSNLSIQMLVQSGNGVSTLNMPSCHPCERLGAAADSCDAEWVLYVPVTRPFIDPRFIDELLTHVCGEAVCDYIGFSSDLGDLSSDDNVGLFGEVCHVDALRRIRRSVPSDESFRNDPQGGSLIHWLQRGEGAFHLKLLKPPQQLRETGLRLSLRDEQDWAAAEQLCDSIDPDDYRWEQIARAIRSDRQLGCSTLCVASEHSALSPPKSLRPKAEQRNAGKA